MPCYGQVKAMLLVWEDLWEDGLLLGASGRSPHKKNFQEAQHPPPAFPQISKQAKNSKTVDKDFRFSVFNTPLIPCGTLSTQQLLWE